MVEIFFGDESWRKEGSVRLATFLGVEVETRVRSLVLDGKNSHMRSDVNLSYNHG